MKWKIFFLLAISCTNGSAGPVWHCSRNSLDNSEVSYSQPDPNQFSIASVSSAANVIGVSINDLLDVYSGTPVRIGGMPLSACFMPGNEALTSDALTSLGMKPSAIQALARKSAIVQSNLHIATTENQMINCIAQHFPAVGYLSAPTNTGDLDPCF